MNLFALELAIVASGASLERRKILIIGPTPPPFHGVAMAIRTLLDSSLSEKLCVVHLELADRRGIQHVNKPDLYDVGLFIHQWVKLIGMLMRIQPALAYLVVSQSTVGFLRDSFLIWPAYLSGSRVVVHLHGGNFREWFHRRSWMMKTYVRAVLRCVTRAIVLGPSLKGQFEGLVDDANISVVPNGIDWKGAGPSVRPNRTGSRFTILHLSTLSHLKGALVIVQSIPFVVRQRQDVEFICAGPWSHVRDQRWAEQFVLEQEIGRYVRFPGQVDGGEKQALFESADIFVFPGIQQEGQPLVVLEAMAAGVPVVFTDRGCLRDTVMDGEAGSMVPVNSPKRLADQILWLLDHQKERDVMGKRARQRYEALYTKERHIASMIEVFASSCGGDSA